MKLRAPPLNLGPRRNIKRTNKPNPLCTGGRWNIDKTHAPTKMKPWARRGDELQYMCHKCWHTVTIHEPPTP